MIGDYLYQLTPRDEQVTGIEFVNRNITASGAVVFLQAQYVVPAGRALRLTNAHAFATPAAATAVVSMDIGAYLPQDPANLWLIESPGVNTTNLGTGIIAAFNAPANTPIVTHWDGEIWLPPDAILNLRASFAAGILGNRCDMSFSGLLLPRGTLVV